MRKSLLLALCLGASSSQAAMLLGFGVDAEYFQPSVDRPYHESSEICYTSAKDPSTDPAWSVSAYFEHPIPVIPNLRVEYTPVTYSHNINVSASSSTYDHKTGRAVRDVTLNQLDITPYYEILDNWVELDIGLTFKQFSGDSTTTIESNDPVNEDIKTDKLTPLLYVRTGLDFKGFSADAQAKHVDSDGLNIIDAKAKIAIKFGGLGLYGGYRYEEIKLSDTTDRSKIIIEGPIAGLFYHF